MPRDGASREILTFSERFACLHCGISMPELEPRIFSFNSPHGACPRCTGLGSQMEIDPELVVPDPSLSIGEGAILPWSSGASTYYDQITQAIAERYEVDLDAPWEELPDEQRDLFLYGTNGDKIYVTYRNRMGRKRSYMTTFEGIVPNLERRYKETDSDWSREKIEEYMTLRPCPECKGARLRPESRAVKVDGMRIHEFTAHERAGARCEWVAGLRALGHRSRDRAPRAARDRGAAALPGERRRGVPLDGPRGVHPLGRRGPADPLRLAARQRRRRALHREVADADVLQEAQPLLDLAQDQARDRPVGVRELAARRSTPASAWRSSP